MFLDWNPPIIPKWMRSQNAQFFGVPCFHLCLALIRYDTWVKNSAAVLANAVYVCVKGVLFDYGCLLSASTAVLALIVKLFQCIIVCRHWGIEDFESNRVSEEAFSQWGHIPPIPRHIFLNILYKHVWRLGHIQLFRPLFQMSKGAKCSRKSTPGGKL